jgi:hypothetical protein
LPATSAVKLGLEVVGPIKVALLPVGLDRKVHW